jgi:hypothetical protein
MPVYAPDPNLNASLNPGQGRYPDLSFSVNPGFSLPPPNPNFSVNPGSNLPPPPIRSPDPVTVPKTVQGAEATYQRIILWLEASPRPMAKLPPGGVMESEMSSKPPSNAPPTATQPSPLGPM